MLGWPGHSRLSTLPCTRRDALRLSMAGYLFTLRILRSLNAGPQITSSPSSSWWLPVSQPTSSLHTIHTTKQYGVCRRQNNGLVELQRFHPPLCPPQASAATLCELNYPHRRAMLVLLRSEIPSEDASLVRWLRRRQRRCAIALISVAESGSVNLRVSAL
jgi:hypothetical protein